MYKGINTTCDDGQTPVITVTHSLRGEGFDASEDGTGRGTPLVPVAMRSDVTPKWQDDLAFTLTQPSPTGGGQPQAVFDPIAFDTTQITSPENGSNPKPGGPCHPLAAGAHAPAVAYSMRADHGVAQPVAFHPTQDPISSTDGTTHAMGCGSSGGQASVAVAFSSKDYGADATTELAPTLRAMNHAESHANGGGQMAVAFTETAQTLTAGYEFDYNDEKKAASHLVSSTNVCHSIGANENATAVVAIQDVRAMNKAQNGRGWNDDGSSYTVDTHATQSVAVAVGADCFNGSLTGDVGATMGTRGSSQNASGPTVMQAMQVRRLTPVECERLQGFPDDYTAIPWRNKPASECPDGPRYKALGNSWAVPVVRWIGRRIHNALVGGAA